MAGLQQREALEGGDRGAERLGLRRGQVPDRHKNPGEVPVRAAQDAVRHQDLAPERLLADRRHLPRHPEGRVVPGAVHPDGPALHPGADVESRAR